MTTGLVVTDTRFTEYTGPIWTQLAARGRYYRRQHAGGDRQVGELLGTPHNYTLDLIDQWHGSLKRVNVLPNGTSAVEYTEDNGFAYTTKEWTQNDESILVAKLADRMRESDFDAAVFAAELGKTTNLLVDKAVHIMKVVRELRRGNLVRALKLLKSATSNIKTRNKCLDAMVRYRLCIEANTEISNAPFKRSKSGKIKAKRFRKCHSPNCDISLDVAGQWLELQMAIKPLINDVFALSETLDMWMHENKRRFKARRTLNGEIHQASPSVRAGTVHTRRQYIAYVESQFTASQKIGLRDPATVVWELIPLSFLLDYFLPIGRWLSGTSILNATTAVYVQTTSTVINLSGGNGLRVPQTGIVNYEWTYHTTQDAVPKLRRVIVDRLVMNDLDVPAPRWQTPIDTGNATVKFANTLALLQKAFA